MLFCFCLFVNLLGDKSAVYSMLATLAAEELVPILVNDPGKLDEVSSKLLSKRF